ncbi:MAG: FUSC family protein [Lachnospiraceae bacterium]|nr:FUSC family protein [Lachnospiraceae bacterium]
MNRREYKKINIPHIGMRIIKSAFGVLLCFAVYFLRGRQGTPFYSALAVLWCIQNQSKNTLGNAVQRTVGTVIGALYGLVFILIKLKFFGDYYGILHYIAVSACIIPILYTTVLIKQKKASYFSCVVFLSIVVNHLTDENPYLFVMDRGLDTLIGIFLGLIINSVHIHGKIARDTIFVMNPDDALDMSGKSLNPYSIVSINNMLDDGLNLSFASYRTPASFLESLPDIKPGLPIIAMNGAVLYDINDNHFEKVFVISPRHSDAIERFIWRRGLNCFTTVILEDVLIIYYKELLNKAESDIYEKLHKSPFRNYLNKKRPMRHPAVYIMCVDKTEKILELKKDLEAHELSEHLKILCYESHDYPGYSYIKLYNKNSSVENMMDYLKNKTGLQKVVRLEEKGSKDTNHMVRRLHNLFYFSGKNSKTHTKSAQKLT